MIFSLLATVLVLNNISELMGTKLPHYLKPCSKSDPNFHICAKNSARGVISSILNGDKKLGIPSFQPFEVSEIELLGGNNLKLVLNNLTVFGLENIEVKEFKVDFDTRNVTYKSFDKKLDILANYTIDGRILFIPLKGTGPCKLSLIDGTYTYNFMLDLETRKNKKFGKILPRSSSVRYDLKKATFDLQNLFNGDERLGEQTNKIINENWELINEELLESITGALAGIFDNIAMRFLKNIPLDELVLM